MRQCEVVTFRGHPFIVLEADDLPRAPSLVVVPLMEGRGASHLNPTFVIGEGETRYLDPRLITVLRRSDVSATGMVFDDRRDDIVRAIDVLMGAF